MTRDDFSADFHRFEGSSGPLAFQGAEAVFQGLQHCLSTWPSAEAESSTEPLGTAAGDLRGRYDVGSRFTDRAAEGLSVTAAVCSLIADLSLDWAETAPDVIGLHAAAIRTAAGIVIFAGPARAGKSTLVSRLALEPGIDFVCDDVLPLRPDGRAIALGIAPRLRLPLPDPQGPLLQAMQRDLLLADSRYAYFAPPRRMAFGDEAPIAAFILLERVDGEGPGLWSLPEEDALAAFLRQSITGFGTAEQAFAGAESLLPGLPCARLVYSDLEEAAAFLPAALKDLRAEALPEREAVAPSQAEAEAEAEQAVEADLPALDAVFEQNPLVISRVIGTRHWLTLPEEGTLWEINPTSRALWAMLEIPGTADDLAAILAEDFPDISESRILSDVRQALTRLGEAGLILQAGPA